MTTQPMQTSEALSTAPEPQCAHCRVPMERGFQVDRGHPGSVSVAAWFAGTPEAPKKWSVDWVGAADVAPSSLRNPFPVTTFRCPCCGLLQSYALPADVRAEPER